LDIFIAIFLPATLVVIMFSLGIGLRFEDFKRVVAQPKAFGVGVFAQIVAIPIVAYVITIIFRLPPDLALGLMILSFCPSGVTSNFLSKMANGDVALAVSLTGLSTLLSVFTMPLLVKFAADHFLGLEAPEVNVTSLGIQVFLITAIPVVAGILVRHYQEPLALRLDRPLNMLSTVLFVVVVLGALASNWQLFTDNLPLLGPSAATLNVALIAIGLFLATLFGLSRAEATTISIETGVHNATLGITVGTLIAEQASGLPPFSLPSGVYGILMYLISVPYVLWRRRVVAAG
jgi:BASS family bile acid:Na+ symporter